MSKPTQTSCGGLYVESIPSTGEEYDITPNGSGGPGSTLEGTCSTSGMVETQQPNFDKFAAAIYSDGDPGTDPTLPGWATVQEAGDPFYSGERQTYQYDASFDPVAKPKGVVGGVHQWNYLRVWGSCDDGATWTCLGGTKFAGRIT
jgi:hypothetical protein